MSKILDLIQQETTRQANTIRLIASENYASADILAALGSSLTNKYSEGYPQHRYYEGQEFIDQIELAAIENAKQLFQARFANVQAYSGSPANLAVYLALLQPNDTILGLALSSGGHLTHGHKVSISGKWLNSISYGLTPEGYIDYDQIEQLAQEHKPKLIISGHSAYPRQIDFKKIGDIAKDIGAYHLADISHISGLVATGIHPHPFPYADIITTTTHKVLRGPRGALILTNDQKIANKIDKAVFPGLQGGPHNNNIAGIAIALEDALKPEYTEYCTQVIKNAKTLAQALQAKGFDIVSDGTENHLILVDLRNKNIDGDILSKALNTVNIETNKNTIPFDTASPFKPNGIRLGTPAVTTLGLKEQNMETIAEFIHQVVDNINNQSQLEKIKTQVIEFISQFKY
ncbi:serine hydroxymethyltransferase [bacterium]|nr:serine hydroxymethyltransferase [Candidatus Elulimicrobium humile]